MHGLVRHGLVWPGAGRPHDARNSDTYKSSRGLHVALQRNSMFHKMCYYHTITNYMNIYMIIPAWPYIYIYIGNIYIGNIYRIYIYRKSIGYIYIGTNTPKYVCAAKNRTFFLQFSIYSRTFPPPGSKIFLCGQTYDLFS